MAASGDHGAFAGVNAQSEAAMQAAMAHLESEIPDKLVKLDARQRKYWDYATKALYEAGLIHRTDAMLLHVICRTFAEWVTATEQADEIVKNGGSLFLESGNGYISNHPVVHNAARAKGELLKWLPEAALTIPSFQSAQKVKPQHQPGLFDEDPVEAHRNRKPTTLRAVQ